MLSLLLPLLGALAVTGGASDSVMGPGVSRPLAERRAAHLARIRYDLALDLTRLDTARGRVSVRFQRRRGGDVVLDFRGPQLSVVSVNGRTPAGIEWNRAHVRIPAAALRDGENRVDATFKALIAPAGASIIRFHDETDGNDYLYTLLVPADANALFPCFDQPDLKARVATTLTVPARWVAVSNGRLVRTDSSGSAKTLTFARSEPLPTYLLAFAAGPWRTFTGGPRHATLYVRASRAREVEVDSLQNQVASALTSLERYFGIRYPFQKFDYLLSPAFPFGGMEHPGVTMFNEESFIYREPPTLAQRLGRRATIYHEVAHQWFGDYVTMRWFDDLWLKEGFATYMAAKMQDVERLPNPWMTFYLRNKPAAYDVDETAGTTSIWQPLANLDQAKSNYGAIVYNKAPGVLKQLNYLVGDSAFRRGVHAFLTAHAYGNATWRDLLGAIAVSAGRPLAQWGQSYILRPGMPVIEQHLDVAGGRVRGLALVQHPAQPLSGRGGWPVRTQVLLASDSGTERIPIELRGETTFVRAAEGRAAPNFVYANLGDQAYGLVVLDPRSASWLEAHVGDVGDPFLRAMLWGSLWDLVREARLAPSAFLTAAMRDLPREPDEQIAGGIAARMARVVSTYVSAAQRDSVMPGIERLLLAGIGDATRPYGIRKAQLDAYIELARTPAALARVDAWLDSASAGGLPLRQPSRWSIVTTLVSRSAPSASARLSAESRRDTTTGGQRRAFVAGAARPDPDTKRRYFDRYFGDSTLNEDWVTASLRAFNDPDHQATTLPYLTPALDSLRWIQANRRIFFLGSWLGAFVGGQSSPAALATVDHFLADHPTLPTDLHQKVLQVRDELERTVRIRARFAGSAAAADGAPAP